MTKTSVKLAMGVSLASLLLSGCGTEQKERFAAFESSYKQASYCAAADAMLDKSNICEKSAGSINPKNYNIDEQLNAGTALFLAQRHELSETLFTAADKEIQDGLSSTGILRGAVEILGNASAVDYNPMVMDSIYLYSYNFLNALAKKDTEGAKILINRAHTVQQDAVKHFSSEIEKQKSEMSSNTPLEEMSKEVKKSIDKSIASATKEFSQFKRWKGYANFVNPYMTYLSGLYFMTNGTSQSDYETASNYFKRVVGMSGNKYVRQDLKLANKLAGGSSVANDSGVWVIFENGLAPNLEEKRLDLPTFLLTKKVKTISVALPFPKQRDAAYSSISVSNGKSSATTTMLADMDNVFLSEFNKRLPVIIAKEVTKVTLQTAAQIIAQNKLGDLGGIAVSAYSVTTAAADIRSWHSLPKNIQLAKIQKNGNNVVLHIGSQKYQVEVSETGNSIIYVRAISKNIIPTIQVFDL